MLGLTMSHMSTQDNKAIIRSLIDGLFTEGDLGAVDAYLAPDFVMHDPPLGVTADREGTRTAGELIRKAFPDWHSDLDMLIAEDDVVVERLPRQEPIGASSWAPRRLGRRCS